MLRVSDSHIPFEDLRGLLKSLGFNDKINGDHHIFTAENVFEILNLQPKAGKCKPYQIKQVRKIFLKYKIRPEE